MIIIMVVKVSFFNYVNSVIIKISHMFTCYYSWFCLFQSGVMLAVK